MRHLYLEHPNKNKKISKNNKKYLLFNMLCDIVKKETGPAHGREARRAARQRAREEQNHWGNRLWIGTGTKA